MKQASELNIPFPKKRTKLHLAFAIGWTVLGSLNALFQNDILSFGYLYFVLAFAYICLYFYQVSNAWISLDASYIYINGKWGKKIPFGDIREVKSFAGDYIIRSEQHKDINVTISALTDSQRDQFEAILKENRVSMN